MRTLLTSPDWLALLLWLVFSFGYQWFAWWRAKARPSLLSTLHTYRERWMRNILVRENRISDAVLVNNLMQSATFFSSTTVLIMGGLLALLGTAGKSLDLITSIPFAAKQSAELVELKVVVMLLIFVHAFLRFTWALRQFNVLCIIIGCFPGNTAHAESSEALGLADRAGRLAGLAGEHFTQGLRSYYYALPVLLWFVGPWLFGLATLVITFSIYYMEFHSSMVHVIAEEH